MLFSIKPYPRTHVTYGNTFESTVMHFILLSFFLSIGLLETAHAQAVPEPPQVPVKAYVLQDFYSGVPLAKLNADEPMEPASITKLMTAYVVYDALREGSIQPTDMVNISEKAWRTGGSRMFVEVGTQVPVENLLMGMVVQSGNDATVALAEHIAGSEEAFAALMNREAVELGLSHSHFVNATGLPDPNHYMSAQDIATLVSAVIKEFPEHYAKYSVKSYTYNDITQHNRNRLLWQDESVDGVKTGHTSSAGYCLAASAQRDEMRLISVVLGADTEKERFSASRTLLNYGFRFYETHKLYDADEPLIQARIYKGEEDKIPLGLSEPLYVTIPKGRYEDMKLASYVDTKLEAPVSKGAPVGSITVTLSDDAIAQTPLVALTDVGRAGLVGRLVDSLLLMFNTWGN